MTACAPVLESKRLVLRPLRAGDLDEFAATMALPEVTRFLSASPLSREDAWRRMLMCVGQWPLHGFGYWAVTMRAGGRLVGHCGFADMQRAMKPDITGEPEMGWVFDPSVHGQGIAYEACTAALAWADHELATSHPAIMNVGNDPAMRLAHRLGFERLPDAQYDGMSVALFRRLLRGLTS